ncbi:MAG: imidazolonepropionase [Bacteroidetes bacterium]|nr:MAG: imidazolonepropionase [Bacteroidota bacterium]
MASFLLTEIRTLYVLAPAGTPCLRGAEMAHPLQLSDAYLYIEQGRVAAYGSMAELDHSQLDPACEERNCQGRLVLPGFVDSHTHLVFPRYREQEFVHRLQGLSYEEIARRGGGILNSAAACAAESEESLLDAARDRAREILAQGTTTVEIKSGYGLSLESELKLLRVARQLAYEVPLRIRTTFLGAHAIPAAYRDRREAYIDLVCEEMLPAVAAEGLADHIDVFCDEGFFTVPETNRILEAGAAYGLPAKIHANELANSGGVQVGVAAGAWSVDHLERIGPVEVQTLQQSDTVPTLLPTVAYFLGIPYAPARALIEAGLPVALASDYNPGSSPGGSMPLVMSMACTQMKMLPEEALVAATLNGAFALRLSDQVGSLAPGMKADLVITRPIDSLARLPYSYASDLIEAVMIAGRIQVDKAG